MGRRPLPGSGALRAPAEGCQAVRATLPVACCPAEVGGSRPADGPQGGLLTAALGPQVPVGFQLASSFDRLGGRRIVNLETAIRWDAQRLDLHGSGSLGFWVETKGYLNGRGVWSPIRGQAPCFLGCE